MRANLPRQAGPQRATRVAARRAGPTPSCDRSSVRSCRFHHDGSSITATNEKASSRKGAEAPARAIGAPALT